MCGRYFRRSDKQRIAEAFHLGVFEDLPLEVAPSYNIAPTTMQPVIRNNRDTGEREMVAMRWAWCRTSPGRLPTSRASQPSTQRPRLFFQNHYGGFVPSPALPRPADGFYEWKRLDEKTKQPYAFALRSGEPFAFGGVWDAWKDPRPKIGSRVSASSHDPNELTATVHDRMPVILKSSDHDRWLDRTDAERPPVDLLRPYEAAGMEAHPVDRASVVSATMSPDSALRGSVHRTLSNQPQLFYADLPLPIAKRVDVVENEDSC